MYRAVSLRLFKVPPVDINTNPLMWRKDDGAKHLTLIADSNNFCSFEIVSKRHGHAHLKPTSLDVPVFVFLSKNIMTMLTAE